MVRKIALPGYIVKDGKIVRDERQLSVSLRLKRRGSAKVRVVRPGAATVISNWE